MWSELHPILAWLLLLIGTPLISLIALWICDIRWDEKTNEPPGFEVITKGDQQPFE